MAHKLCTLPLLISAFVIAQNGFASTVTWNLTNVAFSDGATASGSFSFDADSNGLSNWNISVTSGNLSAFTYNPADSTAGSYFQESGYQNELLFMVNGSTRQLRMTPLAALTDAGGSDGINLNTFGGGSGSVECFNCGPYRLITSGEFDTGGGNSPEPASAGLLGIGLAGAGVLARRWRKLLSRD